jgi:hypothetical protein
MWSLQGAELPGKRGMQFAAELDAQPVSLANVLRAWSNDAGFRSLFNAQLADAPYTAFPSQSPPVADATRAEIVQSFGVKMSS